MVTFTTRLENWAIWLGPKFAVYVGKIADEVGKMADDVGKMADDV